MSELRQAVYEVLKAVSDEGQRPEFHRVVAERHRREWPTLWKTLDELNRAFFDDETARGGSE